MVCKMKRIMPKPILSAVPCSVCAMACALGVTDRNALKPLKSPKLHADGYLSLNDMNSLVRANLKVTRRENYRRGERPILRDFCHGYSGRAIVCLEGHYVYVEGGNYHSFFWNGDCRIVSVWYLDNDAE